jgi:hypothetical protein
MPLPERIKNAPELFIGNELYYEAFSQLTSSRQVGMGLGPVPTLAIIEWGLVNNLDADQREDLLWFIPRLDAKYLEWANKKNANPTRKS